ncbi:MAG: TrkH family potassium uptake protein [Caldicoprobacterales bacterium]|jgi:trk system potassium uptake protein TrkH|nr:TrkH family potassium uptake protein [Clostridiales bacterium]
MNYRMIFKSLGSVLCIEAVCMVPSLLVSIIYSQGDTISFLLSIMILVSLGLGLRRIKTITNNIYARDGFAIVALGWLSVSIFGALPFLISGAVPSVIDALFESASAFSTTGASIIREIEGLPKGIVFWRSFAHWMGGMGVLVLMIAILPSVKANTLHIMKAESPGPDPGKFVPRIKQTAKILYTIYVILTAVQVIFLLVGGMPLYDSLIHAFGTASTGGFSNRNASVGAYGSVYIETIITIFMLLFGVNFSLYYAFLKGNIKSVLRDEELRFYLGTVMIAILLIVFNTYGSVFQSLGESIRYTSFQVSSIITTTGYATADFTLWPAFSQALLVILMFIGASAGSTAGGMKCIRILLLFKIIKREVIKIIHPRSVQTVKINGRIVEEEILSGIMTFFFAYIAVFTASVIIVSLDNKDLVSTATAVIACLSNIGPGLGIVGPAGNFADFSLTSKAVLSLCMIIGRLEIYPILLLFAPTFWKRVNM